jgi:hypothetical protein
MAAMRAAYFKDGWAQESSHLPQVDQSERNCAKIHQQPPRLGVPQSVQAEVTVISAFGLSRVHQVPIVLLFFSASGTLHFLS